LATSHWTKAATRVAVTTDVELSGPAMVKGTELRSATTDAPIVVEMKVAAIP
jgi:hypothetical protein